MKQLKLMLCLSAALLLSACSLPSGNSSQASTPYTSSDPASESSSEPSSESSSEPSSSINPISKTSLGRDYQDYSENQIYNTSAIPINGTPKVLVIPVWFTDSENYIPTTEAKTNVIEDLKTAFEGSESETGWQSVKTYYETLSDGSLSLDFAFSDWYECGYTTSRAGSTTSGESVTVSIVEAATDWYFENNPNENRTDYDYNSDGFIDGVMTIYAAPNYGTLGSYNLQNLWAYCYWVQDNDPNVEAPLPNCFFWASYDFMYDSSTALTRVGNRYGGGDCSNSTLDTHTYIHETGHCIGYDNDFYDYTGSCVPAGGFSMQDQNVGSHDPYSVMASGWADPYIPTDSCTITIGAFQETHDLILLTPEWNDSDSPFDEYLLLELYTPTGLNEFDTLHRYSNYPQGPSATGIRLWHVDARLATVNASGRYVADLFTDPLEPTFGSFIAMSNSYSGEQATELGRSYYNFNILQLIRNSTSDTYNNGGYITNSDLFRDNSNFSMSMFARQFYRSGKLNSNIDLGWSFSVAISGTGAEATATVELYRE